MNINLDENYILSIANDLKYLDDFLPPKINGVLAIQRDLNFNHDRGLFLQKNHPEIIEEMHRHRAEVIGYKTSDERENILAQQVIDFVNKYPKWKKIIL